MLETGSPCESVAEGAEVAMKDGMEGRGHGPGRSERGEYDGRTSACYERHALSKLRLFGPFLRQFPEA